MRRDHPCDKTMATLLEKVKIGSVLFGAMSPRCTEVMYSLHRTIWLHVMALVHCSSSITLCGPSCRDLWADCVLLLQVQQTIQNLIKKHQRIPGSIFHGLLERFPGIPCGDIQQTESELHPD